MMGISVVFFGSKEMLRSIQAGAVLILIQLFI